MIQTNVDFMSLFVISMNLKTHEVKLYVFLLLPNFIPFFLHIFFHKLASTVHEANCTIFLL